MSLDDMNELQRKAYIAGLIQEREGYVRKGNDEGVRDVDRELRRVGGIGKIPKDQAERRPATPSAELR